MVHLNSGLFFISVYMIYVLMKRDIKVWAYLSLQMFNSVYEIVSLFDACVFTTLLSSWWLGSYVDTSRPSSFCLGGKSTLYMTSDTSLFSLLASWCVDFHCSPFSLRVFPGRCAFFLFTIQSAGSHILIVEWTWLIFIFYLFLRGLLMTMILLVVFLVGLVIVYSSFLPCSS